ncbi:bifunctional non-homologous end joining protein LigD [Murinocardiopsis flavida]|uniref:Bifunctional non-homologous end joining protein LigD n=1 Tax=Murinocardiopsis flavida TaxID=645275 RepID=A0A2P8DUM7_9ACTN|nr:non-homologous end-joining DNA ligase [Murinocardiopsis flavida]PSL00905.1 bifunctional non-homologous end joining protein LigD [Murinocardiopsis flavida]
METQWTVGGRTVAVHRPGKEMFGPGSATKADLAGYYARVAPLMLPLVRGRPMAAQRFPHGIGGDGFYAKHPHTPEWVRTVLAGERTMVVCDDAATLVWWADQAAITLHTWLSRTPRLGCPDRLVLDLDPPGEGAAAFDAARAAALDVRAVLDDLGLAAFAMITGSRGVHVVSPIRPELTDRSARDLARIIAELAVARRPAELTTRFRKQARRGRVFVDFLRNGRAQLAVAPYSVRAIPGAPIAAPVTWAELDALTTAGDFTIASRREHCPFAGMARHARSPRKAIDRLPG